MFRSVLPAQAALLPLFGALKMVPEQLRGALSICRLALPKVTVSEAKKRNTTDVFSYKNMAAVEALPILVAGSGEGMGAVWKLVEATLEAIEEYVPKKDAENNYVEASWRCDVQLSSSSPCVCAEYEIIEEQTTALVNTCVNYASSGRRRGVSCSRVVEEVVKVLLEAAQRGVHGESKRGMARLLGEWKGRSWNGHSP